MEDKEKIPVKHYIVTAIILGGILYHMFFC